MSKLLFSILSVIILTGSAFAQKRVKYTKHKVNLLIPAYTKKMMKPKDSLIVYITYLFEDSTKKRPTKLVAKRLKDKTFEIMLPNENIWKIGFGIGNSSEHKYCINNVTGTAFKGRLIDVYLKKEKYKEPDHLKSCFGGID